jgi:hypothetical protein
MRQHSDAELDGSIDNSSSTDYGGGQDEMDGRRGCAHRQRNNKGSDDEEQQDKQHEIITSIDTGTLDRESLQLNSWRALGKEVTLNMLTKEEREEVQGR